MVLLALPTESSIRWHIYEVVDSNCENMVFCIGYVKIN